MAEHLFDVRAYGAHGDGQTLDTAAIQSAIDACHLAGGGRVYLEPGEYLSGTIYLKSNVRFYLESGAVLKGSADIADYDQQPRVNPDNDPLKFWFLVYAENADSISIEGRGTIDGQGAAFWTDEMINDRVLAPKPQRPRALVAFFNCTRLLFRDVSLHNSPTYTLWLVGCETINIDGLSILNPRNGPNTDALDIDCSRNVRISNCHIEAGDDCIALKSDARLLPEAKPCENVVVTNCTLSSSTCAIRVGYEGDAPLRNCVFNNLVIFDSTIGIDIISIIPVTNIFCHILEGAVIEDIIFSDIVMRNVNQPIFIWMGNESERPMKGAIRNIALHNIIAHANKGSYIGGTAEGAIESVELRNVKLMMQGEMDNPSLVRPEVWGGEKNPYALWCSHVNDLVLSDISIDWWQASGDWHHQILCENIACLRFEGFRGRGFDRVSSRQPVVLRETGPATADREEARSVASLNGSHKTTAAEE